MIIKIAEYNIKEGELETIIAAIREFVGAIASHEPTTFYEAFRRDDTFEFVHVMKFVDQDAEERHVNAQYTKKFTDILYPRCEIEPSFTDMSAIA